MIIRVYITGVNGTQRRENVIQKFFHMKDLNWKTLKVIINVCGIFVHFQIAVVQEAGFKGGYCR
jgi:hypothetical protein